MAELTAFRNNALPYPVYGAPWTIVFPLLDATGTPVTGATCDSEISKNGDTAVDCTNEGAEIPFTTATNKGMYYLTLTAAEMTADIVAVTIYSATSKATPIVLYPRKLVALATGTSAGGAVGYITLAAASFTVDAQFGGCLCVATIDSNVEARVLQVCTQADQQCTVTPNWNVAPDADDTYIIYLPEGRQMPTVDATAWKGVVLAAADTAGYPKVTIKDGTGTGELDTTSGRVLSDLVYIHGTALTETDGQLAGRFTDFFDEASAAYTIATALADFKATGFSTLTQAQVTGGAYALNTTASGNVGIDWGNVENPTTAVDLSATAISLVDTASTVTDGATAVNLESFFQLALRSDAFIVADRAAALAIINADEGSGAGDYSPTGAAQEAIAAAITTGFPTNEHADAEPGGGNVVTGTNTANDSDSTWLDNGTYWQVAAAALDGDGFGLRVDQVFTLGTSLRPSQLLINAKETLVGVVHVWAYNYSTAAWDQLTDAVSAISGAADNDYVYPLLAAHQQASDGEVQIRYTSTDTSGLKYLYIDQALITAVVVGSGATPAEIADAVWANRFGEDVSRHIPKFSGDLWFVDDIAGLDTNTGNTVHSAYKTIGAAIAAAAAGDRIYVKAGTYTETGLDMNLAGLEMVGEIGAVIDPATGSALTISATHCYVTMIEVRPAAGEIGFDVAAGSDYSRLTDVLQSTTGATGIKIDSGTSYIVVTRSRCCEYTATGVDIGGVECILDQVVCRGDGGAETGFSLSHTNAHRNLISQCASIDNATRSYNVAAGADDNLFQMCSDSDGCGTYADAGANNAWRGFMIADIPVANVTQIEGADPTDTIRDSIVDDATRFSGANIDVAISSRSSHTAANVWTAGTRTLTSFGTLVADVATAVWAAVARTLTAATNITSTGGATFTQTGDSFDRLGAPAGASTAADIAALKTVADATLVDTGTTLPATLTSLMGATFATGTDSLEAIRNRGDAAWTTGAGGDATAADQTLIKEGIAALGNKAATAPAYMGGTFSAASDAQEAIRDRGDAAWVTGAGGVAGSGADAVTLTIEDDDGDPVANADVWISTDEAGATVVAGSLSSNDVGEVEFMLDAGVTYYCWRAKAGINFDNPATFVAVAD